MPLWSKVSKVPKVPKVPSLFPFIPRLFHLGTFDTGLILLLVLNLIMWSREPTSEPLLQAMGRGWEWTGEIGKKRYANFGRRSTRPLFSYAFPQCQKCQKFHRFLSGVPKVPSFEFWHFGTFGSGTPPGFHVTIKVTWEWFPYSRSCKLSGYPESGHWHGRVAGQIRNGLMPKRL